MKTITATVVYYIEVVVEVDDNATEDEAKKAILDAAEGAGGVNNPIIHDCSDESLID